jgi:hypothetical protein
MILRASKRRAWIRRLRNLGIHAVHVLFQPDAVSEPCYFRMGDRRNDRAGREGGPFGGLTLIHISERNIAGPSRRRLPPSGPSKSPRPSEDGAFEWGERTGPNVDIDLGKVAGRSCGPNDSAVERHN